jgi:hypothetical protein
VLSRWLVSGSLALVLVAGVADGASAARKSQTPPTGHGDSACVLVTIGTGGQAWRKLAASETLCALRP